MRGEDDVAAVVADGAREAAVRAGLWVATLAWVMWLSTAARAADETATGATRAVADAARAKARRIRGTPEYWWLFMRPGRIGSEVTPSGSRRYVERLARVQAIKGECDPHGAIHDNEPVLGA